MFGLPSYLRNAAPSTPIKCSSNGPAYEMHKKSKRKRGVGEEREKGGKNAASNRKKTTTKKHLHAHTFSHCHPRARIFREYKILAVLDCEEQHIYFRFQVSFFFISCLCWIPEVNIQPYPHFGCIFQNPRPF